MIRERITCCVRRCPHSPTTSTSPTPADGAHMCSRVRTSKSLADKQLLNNYEISPTLRIIHR